MTLEEYLVEHPKKYLIFDLDGTLARLEINWAGIHKLLFDEVKKIDSSLTSEVTKNAYEFYSLINNVSQKYGQKAKQGLDIMLGAFEHNNYSGYTPNTQLLTFVHSHKNDYLFSLWTSNAASTIQDFLQRENLMSIFHTIATLDTAQFAKPNPDGFYKIFDKTHAKQDYLLIGDSTNDKLAAHNAGIDFFKVDYFAH